MSEQVKKCYTCLETKPFAEFNKNKIASDGKALYCKTCIAEKSKKWREANIETYRGYARTRREANPERVRENIRKWREANPDKIRASNKKWREENPEKVKKSSKKHREGNPEKNRKFNKKWCERNPEKAMWASARSRSRKAGLPFTIAASNITIPEFCPILGIPLSRGGIGKSRDSSPSLDKIIPGLGYVPGNIAVISFKANRIKNDGTAEELRLIADWIERNRPKIELVA